MKYYLENFTPMISSKIKCIATTRKKIIYLSENGLYEIKNNVIHQYKIQKAATHKILENYIHGYRLVPAAYELKHAGIQNYIPHIHEKIEIEEKIFRLHVKSKTRLFIIKYKGKIIDSYFESHDVATNGPLKEDIVSLVSHFK